MLEWQACWNAAAQASYIDAGAFEAAQGLQPCLPAEAAQADIADPSARVCTSGRIQVATAGSSAGAVDLTVCHCLLQLDDQYGSPSLDDVIDFTRALDAELERILGPDLGGMELEVSSAASLRATPSTLLGERTASLLCAI